MTGNELRIVAILIIRRSYCKLQRWTPLIWHRCSLGIFGKKSERC